MKGVSLMVVVVVVVVGVVACCQAAVLHGRRRTSDGKMGGQIVPRNSRETVLSYPEWLSYLAVSSAPRVEFPKRLNYASQSAPSKDLVYSSVSHLPKSTPSTDYYSNGGDIIAYQKSPHVKDLSSEADVYKTIADCLRKLKLSPDHSASNEFETFPRIGGRASGRGDRERLDAKIDALLKKTSLSDDPLNLLHNGMNFGGRTRSELDDARDIILAQMPDPHRRDPKDPIFHDVLDFLDNVGGRSAGQDVRDRLQAELDALQIPAPNTPMFPNIEDMLNNVGNNVAPVGGRAVVEINPNGLFLNPGDLLGSTLVVDF